MSNLLSRQAECTFWMARQVERANNVARILDVTSGFSREARDGWAAVPRLYADEAEFYARHQRATAASVIAFYVTDPDNAGSVAANLRMARENARALRPLIATEMWLHLNVFATQVRNLEPHQLLERNLSRLCQFIREGCQTHSGITAETLHRDEAWAFYLLGQLLERADQITRLVDVKYEILLPRASDVGSPIDVAQWNALLRAAGAFHAFRRVHQSGMTPGRVAGFLLLNRHFPRSLATCLGDADAVLSGLRAQLPGIAGAATAARLGDLKRRIDGACIGDMMAYGLHETLDLVQRDLIEITGQMGRDFFGHLPVADPGPGGAGQRQAQS